MNTKKYLIQYTILKQIGGSNNQLQLVKVQIPANVKNGEEFTFYFNLVKFTTIVPHDHNMQLPLYMQRDALLTAAAEAAAEAAEQAKKATYAAADAASAELAEIAANQRASTERLRQQEQERLRQQQQEQERLRQQQQEQERLRQQQERIAAEEAAQAEYHRQRMLEEFDDHGPMNVESYARYDDGTDEENPDQEYPGTFYTN